MNYILYDGAVRNQLLPFTFTRPVADLRVGIFTLRQKWERLLESTTTTITEDYLCDKFPMVEFEENIMIYAAFCPTPNLVKRIKELKPNQLIEYQGDIVAFYSSIDQEAIDFDAYEVINYDEETLIMIANKWDIFLRNEECILSDFQMIKENGISEELPETVQAIGKENIFIEEGAKLSFCMLNASEGPIYIGKDAEVMEGAMIRGPFALCEKSQVKMGAKIYRNRRKK